MLKMPEALLLLTINHFPMYLLHLYAITQGIFEARYEKSCWKRSENPPGYPLRRVGDAPVADFAPADLHGQGLGASLLLDALGRAADAIEIAGGRLIVVDAIDESARCFYERHGFRRAPSRPARLIRKASDVAATLRGG